MTRMLVVLPFLAACTNFEQGPCYDLCSELQGECGYAAFPTFDSCYQGCLYNEAERGADIGAELACVNAAECNTFDIMECEHTHGGTGDE